MTDLLRTALPRRGAVPPTGLIVVPESASGSSFDTVSLIVRRHRREYFIGRFAIDTAGLAALRRSLARHGRRAPVVVRISPHLLLEREVSLPLAAEADVGNALRYSLDTLTPFAAHELFWSWAVMRRDRVHKRLDLRLSLVCKAAVEPLIAALERAGASPKLLEFRLPDAETRTIALGAAALRGDKLRRDALVALGSGVAGAILAIVVLPIALQMRALEATEAQIDALRPRVAQVEALRRRLADNANGIDVITHERGRVGDALQVVAIVTDALPDNAYLTELSLHQRKLTMTGEAGDAAKLIVTLSAEPMLRNTEFVAPVTRAPMGGRDLFSIETEVIP